MLEHIPKVLKLFSGLVTFDNKVAFTKFKSLLHETMPSIVITIAHHSRRDSTYRFCSRASMRMTDPRYFPKRISSIKFYTMDVNKKDELCLHWLCNITASMKGQRYDTKACLTWVGGLHCSKFTCKASGTKKTNDSNKNIQQENNMNCVHMCPATLKLTFLL